MLINFYEIPNCTPETLNGAPVLIAPLNTPPELLARYQFYPAPDGRYVHTLTAEEYNFITAFDPSTPVVSFFNPNTVPGRHPDNDNPTAKSLCRTALVLMILPYLMSVLTYLSSSDIVMKVVGSISSLCWIAVWVLLIMVRVKYPQNRFGKVLFRVWIGLFIVSVIAFVMIFAACAYALRDCKY